MQIYKQKINKENPLNKPKAKRLDNNTDIGGQKKKYTPSKEDISNQIFLSYNTRFHAKKVLTTKEIQKKATNPEQRFRHQFCGCKNHNSEYPIKEKKTKYYIGNLSVCNNIHRCPTCMIRLLKEYENQISFYINEHLKINKNIVFVTLTQKTDKSKTSKEFLQQIKKNYKRFKDSRYFKSLKAYRITNTETTYSEHNNGHHHLHILLFFEHQTKSELETEKNIFIEKWCKLTGANKKAQDFQILDPQNKSEKMAQYFAKSISQEMTNTFNKKGKKSYNYLELAQLLAQNHLKNVNFFGAKTKKESHQRIYSIMQSHIEATYRTNKINISKVIAEKYPIPEKTEQEKMIDKLETNFIVNLSYQAMTTIQKNHIVPHVLNICFLNHNNLEIQQKKVLQLLREFEPYFIQITDTQTENTNENQIICLPSEIQFYQSKY